MTTLLSPFPLTLPPTDDLLRAGGDARLALNPLTARNPYGLLPMPDPDLLPLGSSTASPISAAAFAAADRLRARLALHLATEPPAALYAHELARIRHTLLALCGLDDLPGLACIFSPSGTDAHRLAAHLVAAADSPLHAPLDILLPDPAETGTGIPAALTDPNLMPASPNEMPASLVMRASPVVRASRPQCCGHLARTALPAAAEISTVLPPIPPHHSAPARPTLCPIPLRHPDGHLRSARDVDADFAARAQTASAAGHRILLILTDVTKTGLIAPSPACVAALVQRFPHALDVLVDASQFRLAPWSLRRYLERGFMVALTGSKFVAGPSFSGTLLVPAAAARRMRWRPLPASLASSVRADWPAHWAAAAHLPDAANFGLLLRWEAALDELRRFRALPEPAIARTLCAFADAVRDHLARHPLLEPLPAPALDRAPLVEAAAWDHIPTIFPFILYRRTPRGRTPLTPDQTRTVCRQLTTAPAPRIHLGQPVPCGNTAALRLCASAPLIVDACQSDAYTHHLITHARAALDHAATLADAL